MPSEPNEQRLERHKILQVEPVPELRLYRHVKLWSSRSRYQVRHYEKDHQRTVVQWKDAEHPARIENAEIVGAAFGIVENPRDQEARQHEEEIHSAPAEEERLLQHVCPDAVRMFDLHRHVQHHDEKRGQATHSVERGQTRSIVYDLTVALGCKTSACRLRCGRQDVPVTMLWNKASSADAGSSETPTCTGPHWITSERGDVSQ